MNNRVSDIPAAVIDDKMQVRFCNDKFNELIGAESGGGLLPWSFMPGHAQGVLSDDAAFDTITDSSEGRLHVYSCPLFDNAARNRLVFFIRDGSRNSLDGVRLWECASASRFSELLSKLTKQACITNVRLLHKEISHIRLLIGNRSLSGTPHHVDLHRYLERAADIITNVTGGNTVHFNFKEPHGRTVSYLPFEVLDFILCNIVSLTARCSRHTAVIDVAVDISDGFNNLLITSHCSEPVRRTQALYDGYQLLLALLSRAVSPFGAVVSAPAPDNRSARFLFRFDAVTGTGYTLFTPPVFDYSDELSLIKIQLADIL